MYIIQYLGVGIVGNENKDIVLVNYQLKYSNILKEIFLQVYYSKYSISSYI